MLFTLKMNRFIIVLKLYIVKKPMVIYILNCSQTYLPNGTLMIAAHDRDLNNDCDFGFHVPN